MYMQSNEAVTDTYCTNVQSRGIHMELVSILVTKGWLIFGIKVLKKHLRCGGLVFLDCSNSLL